ncbi:MAG: hypothetical protein HYT83_03465 [Candidatus Levybacteria bacterium]|nr:hypothetical protein [Candidatus Levybacteria bacterium]
MNKKEKNWKNIKKYILQKIQKLKDGKQKKELPILKLNQNGSAILT